MGFAGQKRAVAVVAEHIGISLMSGSASVDRERTQCRCRAAEQPRGSGRGRFLSRCQMFSSTHVLSVFCLQIAHEV